MREVCKVMGVTTHRIFTTIRTPQACTKAHGYGNVHVLERTHQGEFVSPHLSLTLTYEDNTGSHSIRGVWGSINTILEAALGEGLDNCPWWNIAVSHKEHDDMTFSIPVVCRCA